MTDAPRSPSAAGPTSAKPPVTILLVEDEPDSAGHQKQRDRLPERAKVARDHTGECVGDDEIERS